MKYWPNKGYSNKDTVMVQTEWSHNTEILIVFLIQERTSWVKHLSIILSLYHFLHTAAAETVNSRWLSGFPHLQTEERSSRPRKSSHMTSLGLEPAPFSIAQWEKGLHQTTTKMIPLKFHLRLEFFFPSHKADSCFYAKKTSVHMELNILILYEPLWNSSPRLSRLWSQDSEWRLWTCNPCCSQFPTVNLNGKTGCLDVFKETLILEINFFNTVLKNC